MERITGTDGITRIDGTPWMWEITDAQLADWGFQVEVTDMMMGSKIVVIPGMKRQAALNAAWHAGRCHVGGTNQAPHARSRGMS